MATQVRDVSTNGASTTRAVELKLKPAKQRVRLPEVTVGLVVLLAFALAAVMWQLNATRKDPVLAVAREVTRGEVLEARDLRVVYVASDDAIAHVPRSESGGVVGRIARTDLEAGALLTPGAISDGAAVESGEGVVGLSLEAGQVPSSRLRPGDLVNVIRGGRDGEEPSGTLLVERAEVFAIEELPASGRLFVSLKTTEANANKVAAAAEGGAVRLVMVGA